MSSIYGKNLKISLFGQSHSPGIGVTVEGLPPGFAVDFEELNDFMSRRRPGGSPFDWTCAGEINSPRAKVFLRKTLVRAFGPPRIAGAPGGLRGKKGLLQMQQSFL